ncbi:MAG: protein kinase [Archangiaceae bacterium]|nr:protein kinase [Archangiaceae bacterium]
MRYCSTCLATYLSSRKCPRDGTLVSPEGGDPLLGYVLGQRYRVLERMAAGAMGQVYRASHVRIASLCAVKVLYGELAVDQAMCRRFQREAEAASMLQSRFITRVLDFGETEGGLPYLVMELLDGPTLSAELARVGRFDEPRAVRIVRRLLLGLSHAHERGIVHRDLKPDNVMLVTEDDEADVPKILDFGIARVRQAPGVTQAGQVMGTPSYMAPEAFFASDVDARADLYSLGIVLFELLEGKVPFDAPTASAVMAQHVNEPVPLLSGPVSGPVRELLGRLLAKKAEQRPASAREVIEALDVRVSSKRPVPALAKKIGNPVAVGSASTVIDRLRATVQQGAPLYNAGDQAGCAALYLSTASALMAHELSRDPEAALHARLEAAVKRAEGKDASRAAWELRYAFDDLLFALTRPRVKREPVPEAVSQYAEDCPSRAEVVAVLDLAALIAARRYEAGHPQAVADFYSVLAEALCQRLRREQCCGAVVGRLEAALGEARDSARGADAAAVLGAAFDELRFEGVAGEAYELPPAEAAVVAQCEQLDEVADALVRAIGTGAAWFNAGDVEGCRRLYLQTAERMLGVVKPGAKNAPLKKVLQAASDAARAKDLSALDAAWVLRHAFDAILEAHRVAKSPAAVSAMGGKRSP